MTNILDHQHTRDQLIDSLLSSISFEACILTRHGGDNAGQIASKPSRLSRLLGYLNCCKSSADSSPTHPSPSTGCDCSARFVKLIKRMLAAMSTDQLYGLYAARELAHVGGECIHQTKPSVHTSSSAVVKPKGTYLQRARHRDNRKGNQPSRRHQLPSPTSSLQLLYLALRVDKSLNPFEAGQSTKLASLPWCRANLDQDTDCQSLCINPYHWAFSVQDPNQGKLGCFLFVMY